MSEEPFRVGSHHLLTGVVKDNGVPFVLTGATLALKLRIDAGTTKSLTPVADPDQGANPGKYTLQCDGTTFDVKGTAYLQFFVTNGSTVHKSLVTDRLVQESLA